MLDSIIIKISDIYIRAERKKELDPLKVENFAENLLNEKELKPIRVRKGNGRYVLVGDEECVMYEFVEAGKDFGPWTKAA